MEAYREIIDSEILSSVIKLPENMRNRKIELVLKIPNEIKIVKRKPFLETNVKLNGYKFNRDEANER